jgi:hypothetical protein
MPKRRTPFYLVVKSPNEKFDEIVSAALVHPVDGCWFYAEVVDFASADCSEFVISSVLPKLRKIPGTRFVNRADLGSELLKWLMCVTGGTVESGKALPAIALRASETRGANLINLQLHQAASAGGIEVDVSTKMCRVDPAALDDFYQHCGGELKVRHNGLVDAVGLTICDVARVEPVNLSEIRHFEFLMGSKSAMSYRAWMRRFEASRSSGSVGAGLAGVGARRHLISGLRIGSIQSLLNSTEKSQ